jgi:hypothetical protein
LRTAVGQELIDPKRQINLVKRTIGPSSGGPLRSPERRKGIRLNIPESGVGSYGNVTELGDGRHCPGESSLFSLTGQTSLESYRTEIGSDGWQSIPISGVSGAQRLFHENPRRIARKSQRFTDNPRRLGKSQARLVGPAPLTEAQASGRQNSPVPLAVFAHRHNANEGLGGEGR